MCAFSLAVWNHKSGVETVKCAYTNILLREKISLPIPQEYLGRAEK